MAEPLRILFLAANPSNHIRLDLESEHRLLRNRIRDIAETGSCELLIEWAARLTELQSALGSYKPHIVHFAGHGNDGGIWMENDEGMSSLVSKDQLSLLFNLSLAHLRLVVLNACSSAPQVEKLGQLVDYIVGTNAPLKDDSAVRFTAHFYQSLAVGSAVREAFHQAQNQLPHNDEQDRAAQYQLLVRPGVDETTPLVPPFTGNRIRIRAGEMRVEKGVLANTVAEVPDASSWREEQPPNERNEVDAQFDRVEAKELYIANKIRRTI